MSTLFIYENRIVDVGSMKEFDSVRPSTILLYIRTFLQGVTTKLLLNNTFLPGYLQELIHL